MTNKTMTAAETYLANKKDTADIVSLNMPGGAVFQFKRPRKFAAVFGMNRLPSALTNGAAKDWTEAGILKAVEAGIESGEIDKGELIRMQMHTRDQVLALSHSPKIVIGQANAANDELSTDDINDEDLAFLFKWVQSGGTLSDTLGNFSERSDADSVGGINRKGRRAAAKRAA